MKKIEEIISSESAKKHHGKLLRLSNGTSICTIQRGRDHCEISIYSDKLTNDNIIKNCKNIMKAFPQLREGFYDILSQRLFENNFTDQRFTDAVNHVIDTCIYPTPTVANFLSYDRRINLYTYEQVLEMVNLHGESIFKIYRPVKIEGYSRPFHARIEDIEKYNLKAL